MQAYSDIYNVKSKWDKDPEVYKAIVDTSSAFGLRNYHAAKERRDLIWPFYSRQSVQRMQKAINRQIRVLVNQLDRQNKEGKLSNMSMAFRCLAQDLMADICLGISFGTLEAKYFDSPLIHALDEGLDSYVLMKSFPTLRNLLYSISSWVTLPGEAEFATYGTIVADHVTKGIQQPHAIPPNTMLGFLVPSSSNTAKEASQPKLTQEHMIEELQTFVIGAGETVASAMVQSLSGILQKPGLYKDVYEEIVQVWPETHGPVPPIEVLEKLPLLTAVIKEALRLTHGVVAPLPRVVSAGGAWIDGYHVPGGTSVGTSHVFIHMSPDHHDAPEKFRHERWLGNSSDKHLVAFSKGPRACMGINLAWCQLYLVLATLVRTIQMDYPEDLNDSKFKWKDCFQPLYYGRPLQVRCTPMEGHS
ncbi:cytochrome P450 [Aspergillus caelatus]|uniref:Cytochrome P450 n=1 Tax=Aspergillus caelatus TaxID=61420 RepID=A0A5N6ZJH9_9EURO|nr:cytochrome P450 [Aspergillus caelatus]KAE8357782.1 cytochrome P450 [Aspergillus caelatus]